MSEYSRKRDTWKARHGAGSRLTSSNKSLQNQSATKFGSTGLLGTSQPAISSALAKSSSTTDVSRIRAASYPKKGTVLLNANLTEAEQQHLESVLKRFDQTRYMEEDRISNLKNDLVSHRRSQLHTTEENTDGRCFRCNRLFVPIFNPAIHCMTCKQDFCRLCADRLPKTLQIVCKSCRFENAYRCKLGVWFTEQLQQSRSQGRVRGVSGPDALRTSLQRINRESRAKLNASYGNLSENTSIATQPVEPMLPYTDPSSPFGSGPLDPDGNRQLPPPASRGPYGSASTQDLYNGRGGTGGYNPPPIPPVATHPNRLNPRPPPSEAFSGSTNSLQSGASGASRGSSASMFSERESNFNHGVPITGELQAVINYEHSGSMLRVLVKQARGLAPVDKRRHSANPYVKCYLLPDKSREGKKKTSYKRRNLNPNFNEELFYPVQYNELQSRTLQLAVWHHATASHNLFMGEVILPMAGFNLDPTPHWYPLNSRQVQGSIPSIVNLNSGKLTLAIKMLPDPSMHSSCELHVWFKSASDLVDPKGGSGAQLNPFARCLILPHKESWSKRKTETMQKTNNPVWDRAIVYRDIDIRSLQSSGLEVTICNQGSMGMSDVLGGVRINSGTHAQPWQDASGTEQQMWITMIENPTKWIEGKLKLRTNM